MEGNRLLSNSKRARHLDGVRAHGWSTIRRAVETNIQLICALEDKLAQNGFDVLPGGQLSVACARWPGTDELQTQIASEIAASGDAWFATVRFAGKTWLRFNLLNLYTTHDHIRFLVDGVTETAPRLAGPAY